ncbi:MAG: hypothetical protein M9905_17045 [Rhizobiaceae bacterium]|nr:hypothetical protein [Rhizobiaceae bacterium]
MPQEQFDTSLDLGDMLTTVSGANVRAHDFPPHGSIVTVALKQCGTRA